MGILKPEFSMECQRQLNWCWAAVTKAVEQYCNPGQKVEQCEVATSVLDTNGQDCCANPSKWDTTASLKAALTTVRKLDVFLDGQVTFEVLEDEIDNRKKPVCARIVWDLDGDDVIDGAHFVVIVGCERSGPGGEPQVWIKDPDGGKAAMAGPQESDVYEMPLSEFQSRYRLYGTWYQTYLVK